MQNLVTLKSHLDGCDEENIETYTNTNIKLSNRRASATVI